MALRAEFTVEPFVEGRPGRHVQAALDVLEAAGFEVEFGPFGSTISGGEAELIQALATMMDAAMRAGATRVSLQVEHTAAPGSG